MAFNFEYKNSPVLSKIQNGEQLYYLKDAEARAALEAEINKLGSAAYRAAADTVVADSDNLVSSKAVIAYLENTIADVTKALIFQGVADENSDFANNQVYINGELMNPGKGDVVLHGVKEYVFDGSKWIELGDEGLYLSKTEAANTYVTKTLTIAGIDLNDNITADELIAALGLGALAKKSSATGTVAGQTITGVKATGTTTGSINVALEASQEDIASAGKFTPAGNVSGTVTVPSHNVPVTITNNEAQATVSTGTGNADVNISVTAPQINVVTAANAGTAASYAEGKFTPAALTTKDVTIAEHDHLSATVTDDETLVFSKAHIDALSFKAVDTFDGGSKVADTFVANTPASFEIGKAIGSISEITGSATYEKVTGVAYMKAEEAASGTCAGSELAIDAKFTGTEGDVSVSGKGNAYAVKTAEFNGAAITLSVGDIEVAAKDITVS